MNSNVISINLYDENFNWLNKINLLESSTWKGKSRVFGDKTHRISSYVAMFSPAIANYFIKEYSEVGDVVLDTFSGRGTTLLESRLLDRVGYALDLNPFAYVLSKAKSQSFNIEKVIKRIDDLEKLYKLTNKKYSWDDDLEIYYSKKNLNQLSFIKEFLGINWRTLNKLDNFILAITLGIMHGPMRKNGYTIYLSLSMSNHTSMSKNYVKNYAKNHNLKKPEDNIFEKIKNRAIYIVSKSKYSDNKAFVKYGNALNVKKYFPKIKPNLIFTSPPYLNIINYTNQNWIKMWLLGYNTREDNKKIGLSDNFKLIEYTNFMKQYLQNISKICDSNSTIILVIGDVKKQEKNYSFEEMWKEIRFDLPELYIEKIYIDNIKQENKATNSMGPKAGKATRVDKIYVFKKY